MPRSTWRCRMMMMNSSFSPEIVKFLFPCTARGLIRMDDTENETMLKQNKKHISSGPSNTFLIQNIPMAANMWIVYC